MTKKKSRCRTGDFCVQITKSTSDSGLEEVFLFRRFHRREKQNIPDGRLICQQNYEPVDADS